MSYLLAFMAGFFTIILIRFLCKVKTKERLFIEKPVKEFVKTFKENPKRFEIYHYRFTGKELIKVPGAGVYEGNRCLDLVTKEMFKFSLWGYSEKKELRIYEPDWLTERERRYIEQELVTPLYERAARLKELRKIRDRKRLIRLYPS